MSISNNTHFQKTLNDVKLSCEFLEEVTNIKDLDKELINNEIVAITKLYYACKDYVKIFDSLAEKSKN